MYPNEDTKILSINDVYPSIEDIVDNSYLFTANFYAVTRGEPQSNVKKLIDWILSDEWQDLIEKTGYVPLRVVDN